MRKALILKFCKEHYKELSKIPNRRYSGDLTLRDIELINMAREEMGYSDRTNSRDILYSLISEAKRIINHDG